MKNKIEKFFKELIPYIIIIIVVILIRTFIITPVRVDGDSMNPTLENTNLLLLEKFNKNYKRFDVIVFNHNNTKLVKRIIGLPGDSIEYKTDKLYINGKLVKENYDRKVMEDLKYDNIPEGKYFVLGDNRLNSLDSRFFVLVDEKDIDGIVNISILPLKMVK